MDSKSCDTCSRIEKTSVAIKWCMDCEDALCENCVNAHRSIKSVMSHNIIELQAISSLPSETLKLQKYCESHPNFIMDFFCTYHDVLCCRNCISNDHRSCENVVPLETAAKDVKQSSLFRDVSDGLNQTYSTIETIVEKRKANIQKIKDEDKTILEAISVFKASTVKKLDEMESLLLSAVKKLRDNSITKLETELAEAETLASQIRRHLQTIDFMAKNGSNNQIFILLQELTTILAEEDHHLEEFISKLDKVTLVYKKPDDMLAGMKNIGSVEVKSEPFAFQYSSLKYLEAQEISTASKTSIKSFKFDFKFNVEWIAKSQGNGTTGIIVTTDNKVILCSSNMAKLQMYSIDGNYDSSCPLEHAPWDLSYNQETGKIVIGSQVDSCLQIVNNFKAEPKVKVEGKKCYGVTWVGNRVFVGGHKELYMLNSDKKLLKTLTIGADIIYYVYHKDNKLYLSDFRKVYCIKPDGTRIFTFSSPDLNGPDGIATDRNGNVYVVGRSSNNIHRLSSDGTQSEVMLKKEDGLQDPIALCFSRDYKKLLISNETGKSIWVFSCEY